MPKNVEIRPLARDDDRGGFFCGEAALDRFFEHYAAQNQFKLHLAVTYVAVLQARIVGFATVASSSIERASVPSARLRKRLPGYPLPVLRLARLGVDTRAQGLGIGKALLRHVLSLALDQRDRLGCVGVVTDAKPDAVMFYVSLGFQPVEGVREASWFRSRCLCSCPSRRSPRRSLPERHPRGRRPRRQRGAKSLAAARNAGFSGLRAASSA